MRLIDHSLTHNTPQGYRFVKAEIRRGVLPEILETLLTERRKTR